MKRSTTPIVLAALAALAFAAAPVLAQDPGSRPGRGGGPGGPADGPDVARVVLRHADLTDEQRETVRGILESAREARTDEERAEMREARHEMVRVMWSTEATEADVQAVAARLAALEQARALDRFRVARAILAELTPEQQARVREFLENPPEPPRDGRHARRGGRS